MPIPFPNNDTTWAAPGRPMVFTTANRAYVPIATDGVNTPTLAVTAPTVLSNQITLTASAFSTFGTVGNQSSQTYNTFNPDGTAKQTINQTSSFGPAILTNFGSSAANYAPGTQNVISADSAVTEQGTTWPPTAQAAPTYTATVTQGANDASNTIPNTFVSDPSSAVSFQVGNFASNPTLADPPDSPDTQPTFTISGLETVCGATHAETRWKVWQLDVTTFQGGTPANDPRSTAVFTNGAAFDVTQTSGPGLTSFQFPNVLTTPGGNDTLYTVGCQTTWELDGTTYRTPYVLQGFTVQAALVASITQAGNGQSTNEEVTLDDLFTQAQIESGSSLIVNIEAAAIVGSRTQGSPAFNVATTHNFTGQTITVNNAGQITAIGGLGATTSGANGGNGGNAFATTMDVILNNSGLIRAGGGGGGAGGQGGSGQFNDNRGQSPTVDLDCLRGWCCRGQCTQWLGQNLNVSCGTCNTNLGPCSGSNCSGSWDGGPDGKCTNCVVVTTSVGGNGGNGGNGAGYLDVNPGTGSSGAAGNNNAGSGGSGGNGGAFASAGIIGQTGSNGNQTSGLSGGGAGQPGAATVSNGNTITFTNTGTIQGAQI